jgi:tRNA G46 methylase TrmB
VTNLCVVSGDAEAVLGRHVEPASVAQVLVNYPEPPLWSGGDGESRLHLLTEPFLRLVLAALAPRGSLTVLSDNLRYLQVLARTLNAIRELQSAEAVEGAEVHEAVGAVRVFKGLPGPECGHSVAASSYFDRLWDNGKHTRRHFLFLRKR